MSSLHSAKDFDHGHVGKYGDRTRFTTAKSINKYAISSAVVDKLIGPPPEHMKDQLSTGHIFDNNTM